MPTQVEVPGHGIVEFPDGMTDDQIATAIRANSQNANSSSKSNAMQFGKGLLSGAADIGNTLINATTYVPRKIESLVGQGNLDKANNERQASLQDYNNDNAGTAFTLGRVASNIAGTAGAPGAVGGILGGLSKGENALALANALKTSGTVGTLPQKIAGAAGAGALQTMLVNPEDTLKGAAISAALPVGGQIASAIGGTASDIARPLTEKGRNTVLAKYLLDKVGNSKQAVIDSLENAKGNTSGFNPTTGQASNNPELATLERVFRERNPGMMDDAVTSQTKSLADAIRGIGGDDTTRAAMDTNRSSAADALYGTAMTSDAQRFEEAIRQANASRNSSQGGLMLGGERASTTTPELDALAKAPAMKDAINAAKTLYANKNPGAYIGNPLESLEGLHYIKLAIDNQLNGGSQATALASHGNAALSSIKQKLLDQIESISPMYGNARKTFTEMSAPINQLDLGNAISDKFIPAIYRDVPVPNQLNYEQLARVANDSGDALAKKVTGFNGATLENTLRPDQLDTIKNVISDAQYIKNGQLRGKPVNSSTFQNLAFNSDMENSILPQVLRNLAPISLTANVLKAGRDAIYKGSNQQLQQKLAEVLGSPKQAAALLKNQLSKDAKMQEIISQLRKSAPFVPAAVAASQNN